MNEELVFNPTRLDISRSYFPVKRDSKGTGFVGRLNVLRPLEVLPGSSWDLNLASLVRFTTPIAPTMDNLYMDVYAYYCSDEMLLHRQSFSPSLNDGNHSFAAVMGAQDGNINMPYPDNDLTLPSLKYTMLSYKYDDATQIATARTQQVAFSLLDQLGYPIQVRNASGTTSGVSVDAFNALPLLGYCAIWNEDFREPNLMNRYSLTITNGLATLASDLQTMCLGTYSGYGTAYGSKGKPLTFNANDICTYAIPLPVCRFHGLYGSLLPFPQRNSESVFLPLGEFAPVYAIGEDNPKPSWGSWEQMKLGELTGGAALQFASGANVYLDVDGGVASDGQGSVIPGGQPAALTPSNLVADLKSATAASINTIRAAFQTQKWFEALARGGNSDMDEYISSLFGVVGRVDVEKNRPVYLGGKRIPISISQVNNTGTNTGETGAFSLTSDVAHLVKYHSKSYGQIFFVFCIRFADTFADAPQKFLFKKSKFDFYFPQFANLGEEEYTRNMLAYGSSVSGVLPLGYQEYGADYRYDVGDVSGQLRYPGENAWHYGNLLVSGAYDLATWLDASWQALAVDRTLKVPGSSAYMHFMYDFLVTGSKYLPMPVTSIPGLVDHH